MLTRYNGSTTVLQGNSMEWLYIITPLTYEKLYLETDFTALNPNYIKIKFSVQWT